MTKISISIVKEAQQIKLLAVKVWWTKFNPQILNSYMVAHNHL